MADRRALRERIALVILATGASAATACGKSEMPPTERAQTGPTPAQADSALVAGPGLRGKTEPHCVTLDVAIRLKRPNAPNDASTMCPIALDTGKHADEGWPHGVDASASLDVLLDGYGTSMQRARTKETDCCYGPPYQPRPIIIPGRALVTCDGAMADVGVVRGPAHPLASIDADSRAIGEAWQRDALLEHASIASFARATLELMEHGAPAALIEATQRASLDEIRHASLCFALASRHLGREISAGPVEACGPRGGSLADLAVRVFVEGCVGETIAALGADRSLATCSDAQAQAALEIIAADEARHAELAWATVAWAVASGGDAVRDALAAAGLAARPELGPHEAAVANGVAHAAWRDVIGPSLGLLLARAPA